MRRAIILLVALLSPAVTRAVPGETDPVIDQTLSITPEAGAWLIYVHSYTGPRARELAQELCLEVRSKYNLSAYTFHRGEEQRQAQREYLERMRQLLDKTPGARIRIERIQEQSAVLVGGYKDMESARKALDQIKKLKPPEKKHLLDRLQVAAVEKVTDPKKQQPKEAVQGAFVNPFATSFVVRNPTVKQETQQETARPDNFLKDLNSGRPYNLLGVSQPWTMAVKEFQGASTLQARSGSSSFLDKIGLGRKSGDLLNASALQAEEVARVLRELKFDAYVLHTRASSIVTVGAFERPDDTQLKQLQTQLANLQLGPIQLFAQPMPMQVPR